MANEEFEGISIVVLSNQPKKYRLVLRQLSNMGIACAAVGNIKKALTHVVSQKPTHMFLSVNIQKMNPVKVAKLVSTTFNIPVILYPEEFGYNTTKMLKDISWPYIIYSSFAGASVANMLRYMIKEQNGTLEEGETPEGTPSKRFAAAASESPQEEKSKKRNRNEEDAESDSLYAKKKRRKSSRSGSEDEGDLNYSSKKRARRPSSTEERREEFYAKNPRKKRADFASDEEFESYEQEYAKSEAEYLQKTETKRRVRTNEHGEEINEFWDEESQDWHDEDAIEEEYEDEYYDDEFDDSEEGLDENEQDYEEEYDDEEEGINSSTNRKKRKKSAQASKFSEDVYSEEDEYEDEDEDDEDFDLESLIRSSLIAKANTQSSTEEEETGSESSAKKKQERDSASEESSVSGDLKLKKRTKSLEELEEESSEQESATESESDSRSSSRNSSSGAFSDRSEAFTEEEDYEDDFEEYDEYEEQEEENSSSADLGNFSDSQAKKKVRRKKKKKAKNNTDSNYQDLEDSVEDRLIEKRAVESSESKDHPEDETIEKSGISFKKEKAEVEATTKKKNTKSKGSESEDLEEEDSFESIRKRSRVKSVEATESSTEMDTWNSEPDSTKDVSYKIHKQEDKSRTSSKSTEGLENSHVNGFDEKSDWDLPVKEKSIAKPLQIKDLHAAVQNVVAQISNKQVSKDKDVGDIRSMVIFAASGEHFNGYIVLAAGHDNIVATELSGPFRKKLLSLLVEQGYELRLIDPFFIQTETVKYNLMMEEIAVFTVTTNHLGEEVGVSFIEVEAKMFEAKFEVNPGGGTNFFKVEVDSIPANTPMEFDMYICFPQNNKFIRYVKEGGIVDEEQLHRLKSSTISAFHLEGSSVKKWRSQVASDFLNSKFTDIKKKKAS